MRCVLHCLLSCLSYTDQRSILKCSIVYYRTHESPPSFLIIPLQNGGLYSPLASWFNLSCPWNWWAGRLTALRSCISFQEEVILDDDFQAEGWVIRRVLIVSLHFQQGTLHIAPKQIAISFLDDVQLKSLKFWFDHVSRVWNRFFVTMDLCFGVP